MATKSKPAPKSFIQKYYKLLAIAAFLLVLYTSSGTTWLLLHTFEAQVMRASDALAAQLFQQPSRFASNVDYSKITIRHQYNSRLILTYPNNQQFGITPEGLRYTQIPGAYNQEIVSITEKLSGSDKSIYNEITAPNPPIGRSTIKIFNNSNQTQEFTLTLTDRSGLYTKPFTKKVRPGQTTSYHLKYHKDVIRLASLRQSNNIITRLFN